MLQQQKTHGSKVFISNGVDEELYLSAIAKNFSLLEVIPTCNFVLFGKQPFSGDSAKFEEYIKNNIKKHICAKSWGTEKLQIQCKECMKSSKSCMCLNCYLNGNHEGHHVTIKYSNFHCCNCGDEEFWKPEGFCPNHSICPKNPDQTEMEPQLRQSYMTAFAIAAYYLLKSMMKTENDTFTNLIISWIHKHQLYGDSIRRCLCIILDEMIDFKVLIKNIENISYHSARALRLLLISLNTDEVFIQKIVPKIIKCLPYLVDKIVEIVKKTDEKVLDQPKYSKYPHASLFEFIYLVKYLLGQPKSYKQIQNDSYWIGVYIYIIHAYIGICSTSYTVVDASLLDILIHNFSNVVKDNPNTDHVKEFYGLLAKELIELTTINPTKRVFGEKANDPLRIGLISETSYILSSSIWANEPRYFNPTVFDSLVAFLQKFDGNFSWDCILDNDVPIYRNIDLFVLVFKQLRASGNFLEWFNYISQKYGKSLEQTCYDIALLPCKLIAFWYLANENAFVRNSEEDLDIIMAFNEGFDAVYLFIPAFALIQMCAEACPNKEIFVKKVANLFGAFNDKYCKDYECNNIFYIFILDLSVYRECLDENINNIVLHYFASRAIHGKVSFYTLYQSSPFINSFPIFMKIIKDSKTLQYVYTYPLMPYGSVRSFIDRYRNENKGRIIPIDKPVGHEELMKLLDTSLLRFIIISYLSEDNVITNQLVLSYLIACSYIHPVASGEKKDIVIDDFSSIDKLGSLDFATYINSNIFINGKKICILVNKTSEWKSLSEYGFPIAEQSFETSENAKREEIRKMKERAAAAKEKALQQMQASMSKVFDDDSTDEELIEDCGNTCHVCQIKNEKPLYIQAMVYTSISPALLNHDEKIKSSRLVILCPHFVHKDCVHFGLIGVYNCALDRTTKNSFIPLFEPSVEKKIKFESLSDIDQFLGKLYPSSPPSKSKFADTIGGILLIIEEIDRQYSNYIDSSNNAFTLQILFSLFWSLEVTDTDNDIPSTRKINDFCLKLLMSEHPKDEFVGLVKEFYTTLTNEEVIPFLRMVSIFEILVFIKERPPSFNWTQYLEYDTMIKHFELEVREFTLPKDIDIFKIPEKAVDLFKPPFDETTMGINTETFYCLLNGTIHLENSSNYILNYCHDNFDDGPVPILFLSGKRFMEIHVLDYDLCLELMGKPIYNALYYKEQSIYNKWSTLNKAKLDYYQKSYLTGDYLNLLRN